ncbi:fimbria/pilus outer membrane usher protein [Marinobacter sp. F4206]|uniref:fimbria/pilus outer membrane usher protein n=1 Tax=Marinobacter sp. F4206 TaxID=2861777 RepID=UPI001C5F9705|nr:fimbria/pilus outer membrane usher protein [Marinobacter sp. F4206]MBW4936625.1 fimbria/pilus outer membrane usher protein [Marinobacter sp. F4206]
MRWAALLLIMLPVLVVAEGSTFTMDLPVYIDNEEAGILTVGIEDMQLVQIQSNSFSKLSGDFLSEELTEDILAQEENGQLPVAIIRDRGLDIRFEPATLQIVIAPTQDQRPLKEVFSSRQYQYSPASPGSDFSTFVNYNVVQGYVHQSRFQEGREPLRGVLDGAINLGFLGPVTMEWEALYQEEQSQEWARESSRLVIDDQQRAIRYTLGDVFYQSTEFQGAPELLGASIERRYGVLQPFNTVTATGQQTFEIQRTSRVDVYVNGILQTSRRLTPGRYNLRDFPFAEGLNDIELVVTDEFGRVERLAFSLFLDSNLLKEGVSEFSFNAGYRRKPPENNTIDYDYNRPALSGFYRHGLTSNLTLGGQFQGEEDLEVYGLEGVLGTPVGTFSSTVSRSESEPFGSAMAGAVRWRYEFPSSYLASPITAQIASIFNEQNYLSLGQDIPSVVFRTQHQARVSSSLYSGLFFSAAYRQAEGFQPEDDERGISLSLSQRFNWFNVNLYVDYVEAEENDTNVLVNVSVPLGYGRQVRATYNRQQETSGIQYSDYPVNAVHDFAGSLGIERNERDMEEHQVSGNLDYTGNRFVARVDHDYTQEGFFEGETEERSQLELGGALVFSDGYLALSRPIFDSFVMVDRHESLSESDILVNETAFGPSAIANDFGPAVVPDLVSYREQQVYWEAASMPMGYDMGDMWQKLTPSYKSGTVYTAGSAASVIAIGIAVPQDPQDIALRSGVIEPADGRDFPQRQTFTNRKGRFVVQKLEPGEYRITFDGNLTGSFSVPEGAVGYVDLGKIIVRTQL